MLEAITTELKEFLSKQESVAFLFSGGKDSALLLHLLEQEACAELFAEKVTVLWANPGNPLPAVLAEMKELEKRLPNFRMVLGEQPVFLAKHGYPLDTVSGLLVGDGAALPFKHTTTANCCFANLQKPLWDAVKGGGFTAILSGAKQADAAELRMVSGVLAGGIELFSPLADLSDEEVFQSLPYDKLPFLYKEGCVSSMDCMNCTGWVANKKGHLRYLASQPGEAEQKAFLQVSAVHLEVHKWLLAKQEELKGCYGDGN